jgi:GTP-binding protein
VREQATGQVLCDLAEPDQQWTAAKGGLGGRGNARFVSSTRQVPRFAQDGQPGEEAELILELKLMADVGLVGFPNAGKSTLISVVSAARPKIADYPFTTLVPNLGVVAFEDAPPFVMADIPGLIEGAHEGVGLGIRFLRHIERTRVLLHLIDVSEVEEDDPLRPLRQIENELASYAADLPLKERIIALNKADLVQDQEKLDRVAAVYRATGSPTVVISALARKGLHELLRLLIGILNSHADVPANSL